MRRRKEEACFKWVGISALGAPVQGQRFASSRQVLWTVLSEEGITPLRVRKKYPLYQKKQVAKKSIVDFTEHLASLLDADISLEPALDLLAKKNASSSLNALVCCLQKSVTQGLSLSESLQKFPQYFSPAYCAIVLAGEESGNLGEMLLWLSQHLRKMLDLKAHCQRALYYPVFLLVSACMLSLFLLLFVVPRFQQMFSNFHAKLPWLTGEILNVSEFLGRHGVFLLVTLSVVIIFFKVSLKNFHACEYALHALLLKVPLVGKMILQSTLTFWCQIVAAMTHAGIPISGALVTAGCAIHNYVIKERLAAATEKISAGESLHDCLVQSALFSEDLLTMVRIGENTGTLSNRLSHIACYQERALKAQLSTQLKLLEPILMSCIALISGVLIAGLYLPIIRMGSVLR